MRTSVRPRTLGLGITILVAAALILTAPGCKKEDAAPADAPSAEPAKAAAAKTPTEPADKAAKVDAPKDAADPELEALCGKAFENMLTIMEKEQTPPDIVAQFRKQTTASVARCIRETTSKPDGRKSLDCMLAAKTNADILTCSGAKPPKEKDTSTPAP